MEGELLKLKLISKTDIKNQSKKRQSRTEKYFTTAPRTCWGWMFMMWVTCTIKWRWAVCGRLSQAFTLREEGFGIRLENNVVIQKKGVFDFDANHPVDADEIEDIMNSK